jgi:GNAT superfamily N-acetyltransferase
VPYRHTNAIPVVDFGKVGSWVDRGGAVVTSVPRPIWIRSLPCWSSPAVSSRALEAIAELERRVIEADGGRVMLESSTAVAGTGSKSALVGGRPARGFPRFLRLRSAPELAGMVALDARRRGFGSGLLDAALSLCRERGDPPPLLIVAPLGGRQALGVARRQGA